MTSFGIVFIASNSGYSTAYRLPAPIQTQIPARLPPIRLPQRAFVRSPVGSVQRSASGRR